MGKSTQMLINERFLTLLREMQEELKSVKEQNQRLLDACNDLNTRIYELSLRQSQPERYRDPVRPFGPYYDDRKSNPWWDPNKVWCKTDENKWKTDQPRLLDDETWNNLKGAD